MARSSFDFDGNKLRKLYWTGIRPVWRARATAALQVAGNELKDRIAQNFDVADSMMRNSAAGRTMRVEEFTNPGDIIRMNRIKVESSTYDEEVIWFQEEWLNLTDQIERSDYIVASAGKKGISVKGRRIYGNTEGMFYYWRFLEYGTISPVNYLMGTILQGGKSYYFMALRDKVASDSKTNFVEAPTFPAQNCLSKIAGNAGVINNVLDRAFKGRR